LNWILNRRVTTVTASGDAVFKNRETIDHAALIVDYENGAKLSFDLFLIRRQCQAAEPPHGLDRQRRHHVPRK
jgi:hypothetical protein